jgi:RNase P subunit RPR2
MSTALHTLTTTAHTASGLVPICHCGWTPRHVVANEDEVALLLIQHNEGFTLQQCPDCASRLKAREAKWRVKVDDRHFTDVQCPACGWRASQFPR